jgi:subtilisin family serine protease
MTAGNKKSMVVAALVMGLFAYGFSTQKTRGERERKQTAPSAQREIRWLGGGQPLRSGGPRYAAGQALVRFRPSAGTQFIEATLVQYGITPIKRIARLNLYLVEIPASVSVEEMTDALRANPDIQSAGPNYIARITVTPNDPLFRYQYALHNTGQDIASPDGQRGTTNADINAPAGWDETEGSSDTVIAIIDSGIDFGHPDLKNKIVSRGHDFSNNDDDATDDNGHGTFVAGVAAAETDNDEGIAGVAWNCLILPVKVTDAEGLAFYSDVIDGILWAADNGADVINLSLGSDAADDSLRDALAYAHGKGVVIAASAGNDATTVFYPAAYDAYCLAIAATDYNDERPSWSCFGPQVDVAAPGVWVLGAFPTYMTDLTQYLPYAFGTGTSASSPHVAGLAALLKGLKPWLSVDDIMNVIRFSSDDVNSGDHSGKDDFVGYGRINMEKALVPIKLSK